MRYVVQELPLCIDEGLQPVHHPVEFGAQVLEFVIAESHSIGDPDIEVPARRIGERRAQIADRFR